MRQAGKIMFYIVAVGQVSVSPADRVDVETDPSTLMKR